MSDHGAGGRDYVHIRASRELVERAVKEGTNAVHIIALNELPEGDYELILQNPLPSPVERELVGEATTFTVGFNPRDDELSPVCVVRTKYEEDVWAIRWRQRCLNRDGEWEWEPLPSSRDDHFLARCRFPRDEALRRARAALPPTEEKTDG